VTVTWIYLSDEHRRALDALAMRLGYVATSRKRGLSRLIEALIEEESRSPRLKPALPMPRRSLPKSQRPVTATQTRRQRVIALHHEGRTSTEIAALCGVTKQAVSQMIKRYAAK
jgi:DNA-binding NarL/FixJ family response regulator